MNPGRERGPLETRQKVPVPVINKKYGPNQKGVKKNPSERIRKDPSEKDESYGRNKTPTKKKK